MTRPPVFSLVSGAHKDKAQLYPVELLPAEIQEKFKYRGGRIPLLVPSCYLLYNCEVVIADRNWEVTKGQTSSFRASSLPLHIRTSIGTASCLFLGALNNRIVATSMMMECFLRSSCQCLSDLLYTSLLLHTSMGVGRLHFL